jgi:hypothetical protein
MDVGEFMDVTEKNIKIRSFNHDSQCSEYKLVESLVFKGVQTILNMVSEEGKVILRAAEDHCIWNDATDEYARLRDVDSGVALKSDGSRVYFSVVQTNEKLPVVDMHVQGNENYFTNDVLSHNTGGNALKFFAAIRLVTRPGDAIEEDGNQIGMTSRIRSTKNKVAPPHRNCEMKILFDSGYQIEEEYVLSFQKYGIIKKAGGWFSIPIGGEGESEKIHGAEKVIEWLQAHPAVYDDFKAKLQIAISRKTTSVIVEATDEDENTIIAEQEVLEKEALAEDPVERLAEEASAE